METLRGPGLCRGEPRGADPYIPPQGGVGCRPGDFGWLSVSLQLEATATQGSGAIFCCCDIRRNVLVSRAYPR